VCSSDLDNWDLNNPLLISGHIHEYDLLQPNMIYVGTPYQHGFGDISDKTISIFTFLRGEWSQERIRLNIRRKETIYITPEDVINYEPPSDQLVKLVVKGEESVLKSIIKLEKITELKKKGVKVVFKPIQRIEPSAKIFKKMSYKERLLKELLKRAGAPARYPILKGGISPRIPLAIYNEPEPAHAQTEQLQL